MDQTKGESINFCKRKEETSIPQYGPNKLFYLHRVIIIINGF